MSTISETRSGLISGQREYLLRQWFKRVCAGALLLGAFTYLVDLLVNFHTFIGNLYLNADIAAAPVIGELFHDRGPGGAVFLGNHPWYATVVWELLTRPLPFHRQLWEGGPLLLQLLIVAAVFWGLLRVGGRMTAILGACFTLCLSMRDLALMLQPDGHTGAWLVAALLAVAAVEIAGSGLDRIAPPRLAGAAACGVIAGFFLSSDLLALFAGVAPLLIAVALSARLSPMPVLLRQLAEVVAVLIPTVIVALLVVHFMHASGVHPSPWPPAKTFVALENVGHNFTVFYQSLLAGLMGEFFGSTIGVTTALYALACAAGLLSLAFAIKVATGLPPVTGLQGLAPADQRRTRRVWVTYWSASASLISLAFLVTQVPQDVGGARYLMGLVIAIGALFPLVAIRPHKRWGLALAVGIAWVLGTTLNLFTNGLGPAANISYRFISEVKALALRYDARIGYANYWATSPITWETRTKLIVMPVVNCAGVRLCGYDIGSISSFYKAKPGVRSFLLNDPAAGPPTVAIPPELGKPLAEYHLGEATLLIYPYDIASRFAAGP